ncbi:hypothetical protein ARMGADRAFT_481938 [Armillaria gallica]|uniref:Uncharacterized protein n=1 Tax=Armillaria gallica TaxID=47427 RepID=A0A2H3DUH2_ARMGA|nr:hypothetical protein ARMGADRAFT_481938 [Armillaria gallica]
MPCVRHQRSENTLLHRLRMGVFELSTVDESVISDLVDSATVTTRTRTGVTSPGMEGYFGNESHDRSVAEMYRRPRKYLTILHPSLFLRSPNDSIYHLWFRDLIGVLSPSSSLLSALLRIYQYNFAYLELSHPFTHSSSHRTDRYDIYALKSNSNRPEIQQPLLTASVY